MKWHYTQCFCPECLASLPYIEPIHTKAMRQAKTEEKFNKVTHIQIVQIINLECHIEGTLH